MILKHKRKTIYHALENTSWWHHLEGKWVISLLSAWRQVFISQQLMIFGNKFVVSLGGNYCEPHIMGWWYVRPRRSGTTQSSKKQRRRSNLKLVFSLQWNAATAHSDLCSKFGESTKNDLYTPQKSFLIHSGNLKKQTWGQLLF